MTPTTYGYDTAYCLKSHCGVRGYCRPQAGFQFKSSANSVMRGCVHARRTLKGLVADLRFNKNTRISLWLQMGDRLLIGKPLEKVVLDNFFKCKTLNDATALRKTDA